MMVEAVWRTTQPEVIALFDKWEAEEEAWAERRDAFMAKHDPSGKRGALILASSFGRKFAGMEHLADEQIPEGWRLDKTQWALVPYRTSKAGKVVAKELDACQPPPDPRKSLPGMPSWSIAGLRVCTPGVEPHGTAIYVIWSTDSVAEQVDESVWERVKLSEYHAILEAESEAA